MNADSSCVRILGRV